MVCKNCKQKPVIQLTNSSIKLCRSCFIKYFEKKAKKTIRQYHLMEKNDHIAIACSGGKDSSALLHLMKKIKDKKRDLKITAILVDEGITPYRDINIKHLKKLTKKYNITLKIYSFKKEFGLTLDEMIKITNKKHLKIHPCTICGVLRKYLLNKGARALKANKLATAHNLDDESQSILMNQIKNNIEASARLGPMIGVMVDKKFIRRVKPFYMLTEKEIMTYAFLNNLLVDYKECPYAHFALRDDIRNSLNTLEEKYPGSKHAIIQSFLDILPLLKNHFKSHDSRIKYCKLCKEPSSQDICQACNILKQLKA